MPRALIIFVVWSVYASIRFECCACCILHAAACTMIVQRALHFIFFFELILFFLLNRLLNDIKRECVHCVMCFVYLFVGVWLMRCPLGIVILSPTHIPLLFVFNSSHLYNIPTSSCVVFFLLHNNIQHATYICDIQKKRSNNKSRALFSKYDTRGIFYNKVRWISHHIVAINIT